MFNNKTPLYERPEDLVFTNPNVKLEQKDMERVFTRLFSTDDGKRALSYLQTMTFQRAYGPTVSDEQLRHTEGQRSLVATILRMIDRGRGNS
jgi:hypothetical protein